VDRRGGPERRQVAEALRSGASVLLLDEPTNHLDAPARQWLLCKLPRFAGAELLVELDGEVLAYKIEENGDVQAIIRGP
jgi:ATPase subunit of ABC transporter with duplicated ATPase domains